MTNQTLAFEFGEDRERLFDGSSDRPCKLLHPKIDNIERVESEISKVVMNAIDSS